MAVLLTINLSACNQNIVDKTVQIEEQAQSNVLTEIAFGSCTNEDAPQPLWNTIASSKPQIFLYLGDNVYADVSGKKRHRLATKQTFKDSYQKLANNPDFDAFRKQVPIFAGWDDHDTGMNDGGRDNPVLPMAKKFWLDFFKIPMDSPVRTRAGIYDSKIIGKQGQRVQIIMLDTRSFRSALTKAEPGNKEGYQRFKPSSDENQEMLGETQWQWLEQQLKQPAEVRIIASSIQVIANNHGYERWGNLPKEQQRFYQLLKSTEAKGVVLISGDRHTGSLYKRDDVLPYPLIEVTSSSINSPISNPSHEMGIYQKGEMVIKPNFGSISIDWEKKLVKMQLSTEDDKGVREIEIRL
jgi:alkaline phosphatase D